MRVEQRLVRPVVAARRGGGEQGRVRGGGRAHDHDSRGEGVGGHELRGGGEGVAGGREVGGEEVVEVGEGQGVGVEVHDAVEALVQAEDVQLAQRGVGVRPPVCVSRLLGGTGQDDESRGDVTAEPEFSPHRLKHTKISQRSSI